MALEKIVEKSGLYNGSGSTRRVHKMDGDPRRHPTEQIRILKGEREVLSFFS